MNLKNILNFKKINKTLRKQRAKKQTKQTKQTKQKFKRLKCAPQKNNTNDPELKDFTCYSRSNLQTFKELWNNNSDDKISTNNSKEIWQFFKNKLSKECYDELCWLKKSKLSTINNSELLIKEIFKPFSPKTWITNPSTWLSSVDITKIMSQYEKSHSNFKFIGPSPIDFDTKEVFSTCVWEQLCNFNLKEYINKNITKIGIIFNTDTHDKPGKHWIALFIDLDKKFIFYFDSNGTKMPKQIKVFLNRVDQQALENDTNLNIINTNIQEIKTKKNEILQELGLKRDDLKSFHKKLNGYMYVDAISDLKYGRNIRWINLKQLDPIKITNGSILCDIKIGAKGIALVLKGYNAIFNTLYFNENIIFQKINDEEKIILKAVDYLSKQS